MKNIILIISFVITSLLILSFTVDKPKEVSNKEETICNYGRCAHFYGSERNYEQCGNCSQEYSSYCWNHSH